MTPPQHGEIVKPLGDGWAIAWDATLDRRTHAEFRPVVDQITAELRAIVADSLRDYSTQQRRAGAA
jgi:hypothetical protein